MKELVRDVIITFAVVAAIAMVVKPMVVKERSMEPTLYENNYLFVNRLAYFAKEHPDYGDIIVFQSDIDSEDAHEKKLLIKRVIGVENDTITISDGKVYRNGTLLDEDYILDGITEGEIFNYTVPKDQVFVMGDNRAVSLDSRSDQVGAVSEDDIKGKAFVRLYPFDEIGIL